MVEMRSISVRLIVSISLLSFVTCGVLGTFSIVQERSLTRLALDQQLKLQYDSVTAAIDYESRAALAVSTVVAALPPVADAIVKGDRDALLKLLGGAQAALKAQGMPRMMIALPPATVLLRIQEPKTFGDDASARRTTIVAANKTMKPIAGVEMGPSELAIYGMSPVLSDGKSLAVIDIGVSFGKEFVGRAKQRFGVDLVIHSYDGTSFKTLATTLADRGPASQSELKSALEGLTLRRDADLDGHPAAVYLGQIKNYAGHPMAVIELIKDTTEYEAAAAGAQRNLLIGTVIILAVAVFLSYLLARGMSRPLSAITVAMNRLSSGETRLDIPGSQRRDELGIMAKAVEVFRQNAIDKSGLEAAQIASKAAMTRRQEEIDQLIGFFGRSMSGSFRSLSGTSAEMARTSILLETAAQTTGSQAISVLGEVGQTSLNIQAVAAASQQLSASIAEIGRQAGQSARGATAALQQAEDVGIKVDELRHAAEQIGDVVKLINTIAGQTNLLALNATIEAARAGEAGRGFAVVAGEVKALAQQTARATSDIARQVASIQAATSGTADAIHGITGTIRGVNETSVAIASAVEQQDAATQEIARSIEAVTVNAASMARSMEQVQGAVEQSGGSAAAVKQTTSALAVDTEMLSNEVQEFLTGLRELGDDRQLSALDVNLSASATAGGRSVAGRVLKVSPGMVLFDGPLQTAAGSLVEVQIDALDRALRGRFVERIAEGCQIQLLLNHEHLSFMEGALARLAVAA